MLKACMKRLKDRIAFITGAASGIGAATARRFAEEGAVVAGFDLNDTDEGDWAAAVKTEPRCRMHVGSVADEEVLAAAINETRKTCGRIDILFNNAGISPTGPIHELSEADWDRTIEVNLKSIYLACRHVVPIMLEQGSGCILNTSSALGIEGQDIVPAYNASKGAVILLTKNLAIDYGRHGIRANAICPGYIETPGIEPVIDSPLNDAITAAHHLGRMGKAEEIANAAVFLASDEASFITGAALPVDGGYTAGKHFNAAELFDGMD